MKLRVLFFIILIRLFFISTLTKNTNNVFLHDWIQYQNIPRKLERKAISDAPNKKKKNLSIK